MTIAVAVSGGADSLYALGSLREAGERCLALHALFLPPPLRPPGHGAMLERLSGVCAALDIPLNVVDLTEPFRRAVIEPFVRAYARGETPNPCALCNAAIKFGLLLDHARTLGAGALATGHYARLAPVPFGTGGTGGIGLFNGLDSGKDQSYFLSLVPVERLAHARFPLGSLRKSAVREWLAERGLAVPAPVESQEICFVPDDAYRGFVPGMAGELGVPLPGPGPVRLADGREIGRHAGLWRYTEGQRKGLGIAWSHPLYVVKKDMAANALVVGSAEEMAEEGFRCEAVNFLVPPSEWPETVLLRTRYRQNAAPATVRFDGQGGAVFTQHPPKGPYTAGQLATAYTRTPDGDFCVLGGGIISRRT